MDKVSLREYVDTRFDSLKEATGLAVTAMDKRLEGMNRFREENKELTAKFPTRVELNATVAKLEADIDVLKLAKAQGEGKASTSSVYISYAIALVSILISLFYK